jgi:DNA-directed RNA polymerase specialized sigma24 family protein
MPTGDAILEFFVPHSEIGFGGGINRKDWTGSMGMGIGMKEAPDSSGENLSAEEIGAAFGSLSAGDKLKLEAIEAIKRSGTRFKSGQLIHEAVCQAILGERKCPRGIAVMAFLVQTMRSIASHERERQRRFVPLVAVPREGEAGSAGPALSRTAESVAVREVERLAQSAETDETNLNMFDGDEKAQLVLMAWADGYRGKDLREVTGLDQAAVDYAAKRIRGKMRKLYPNGWTK